MSEVKLNIGCGPGGQLDGYINIDNSPSVLLGRHYLLKKISSIFGLIGKDKVTADWSGVIWCDVSKGLRYHDNTVAKIYASHLLEHIPRDKGLAFVRDCYRVLQPGGVMRLVVPDLLFHAEQYVETTRKIVDAESLPSNREAHDRFLNTIYGGYLDNRRYGAGHYYMYDFPTLVSILRDSGFTEIRRCEFGEGLEIELAALDSRPSESLHIECFK